MLCNLSQWDSPLQPNYNYTKKTEEEIPVSTFLEHCQATLQVTTSLEEFSDLSEAGKSSQFDVGWHELKLATWISVWKADQTASAAASHPLSHSTLSRNSLALKRKYHSPCLYSSCQCSFFHCYQVCC